MDVKFENFIDSVKIGNIDDAKSYFIKKFSNKTDKYGLQPIHWASLCSNVDMLKWLLKKKCNIESLSRNGWRPIHFAAFVGDEEMVKFLIENYCKLDCQTDIGKAISDVANGDCEHEFIDEILNETNNLKVALSMGLKCGVNCDHQFCLKSVLRGHFTKGQKTGWGAFAKVYKIRESETDRNFAVRISRKHDKFVNPKFILSHLNRYPNINHENIIKYFGMIETRSKWKIFMEWMEKGSIYDEISKTGSLSDDKIARYCKDILQAVAFLHHNKIIHRDIKPLNIFIDNNEKCKLLISQLSWSLANDEMLTTFCGSIDYMAPEIMLFEPYHYPADIWAVGATVIYMLTGYKPYNELWPKTEMISIEITKKLEYTSPRSISIQMEKFIDGMRKLKPNERATANELLNYELIINVSTDCEIHNSNINQLIIDNSIRNRQRCADLINSATNNQKIALSMGLECSGECKHEFCLSSATATNFRFNEIIGQGGFGSVYKIKVSNCNQEFVVKTTIVVKDIEKETKLFENNLNEYRDKIIHPNIIKYFGVLRNSQQLFIFMELIDGGTLRAKIAENGNQPLLEKTIKFYTKQILEGVRFLHNSKIIHRDIKSDNILLTKTGVVKIADFGLSSFLRTVSKYLKTERCGTYNYMAPEVIVGENGYNHLADIWSVGATVLEMASGRPPYFGENIFRIIFKIGTEKKLDYPSNISNEMKEFLDLMIQGDPKLRKEAEIILQSGFLN